MIPKNWEASSLKALDMLNNPPGSTERPLGIGGVQFVGIEVDGVRIGN